MKESAGKIYSLERGVAGKCLLEGLIFNKGVGNISKQGGLTRKRWRKYRGGGCDPQKKLDYFFGE